MKSACEYASANGTGHNTSNNLAKREREKQKERKRKKEQGRKRNDVMRKGNIIIYFYIFSRHCFMPTIIKAPSPFTPYPNSLTL